MSIAVKWIAILLFCAASASAAESLHRQIDKLIAQGAAGQTLSAKASDTEFLRRVYLDLAGRIPSPEELNAFLSDKNVDKNADKRAATIDKLLVGDDYARRMQDLFHSMLMERRGENPEWTAFLQTAFKNNKPWDQIAREILDPSPDDPTTRGAAYFYTQRLDKVGAQETDYAGLTRDVGRLFLGMDLQCAQCHNHLFIEDYKQEDFQGLFIVYQNTSIRRDVKHPAIAEKLLTEKLAFSSVFDKVPLSTGPRVPGAKADIEIPVFAKGDEYVMAPDRKTNFPGIPKFSPLEVIGHELPSSKNAAFARNIANRLWFVMFGRGIVHPLDLHHTANPPSHPELLELLGHEIVAHQFDIKWMLRELALSDTYQRSSALTADGDVPPESYAVANEKRLLAEQLLASTLQATGPWPAGPPAAVVSAEKADAKPVTATDVRTAFIKAFANPPQEPETEFTPSLKSALFLLNDSLVLQMLVPQAGNLMDRLIKLADAAAVDEMYRSILSRDPTEEERTAVSEYLSQHKDQREKAMTDLAWSLLASTEFSVNH